MPDHARHEENHHRLVIVGGGFGGLYATRHLAKAPVNVSLVDKRNFHLFQPLLYQVASGSLSPGNIAVSLREIVAHQANADVILDEVLDIDPQNQALTLRADEHGHPNTLSYDTLILAPGSAKQYFGNDQWEEHAPGLKTLEDAVRIRRKVLYALECAEKETDPLKQAGWMTFVVVGGGPTGVELAGALSELVHGTMKASFRNIDTCQIRIIMVEAADRILAVFPEDLQQKACQRLEQRLGVTLLTNHRVQSIEPGKVILIHQETQKEILTETVLWTAGVKASPLGRILSERTGCELDRGGRVVVEADCSVPHYPNIFVIGDLANFAHTPNQKPLPGLASVAMQQGMYLANVIQHRLNHQVPPPFEYLDKGNMAIIGRNAAIAQVGDLHLSGFIAWMAWLLVHIFYLIGFDNKVLVTFQWAWNYLTKDRSACLITEQI